MSRHISFQMKLIATYSILIVLLVVVLALLIFSYSSKVFEQSSRQTADLLVENLNDQLENLIKPMDFILNDLISDASFKSSLFILDALEKNPENKDFISEAEHAIRKQLFTYSIFKNFYALTVFNRRGDFFTSNFIEHYSTSSSVGLFDSLPWMDSARVAAGAIITVPTAADPFMTEDPGEVFGRARVMQGVSGEVGCIAVFHPRTVLEELFSVTDDDRILGLVFLEDGGLLYSNQELPLDLIDYYRQQREPSQAYTPNSVTGRSEYLAIAVSAYTGTRVLMVLSREKLIAPLRFTRDITIGIGLVIIIVSLVYIIFSSKLLTRPLRLIQQKIEDTQITNLGTGDLIEHDNDEIVALDRAFFSMQERLSEAIDREVNSKALWHKARLDTLQAQVDPHFINNILTVIASRGLELGDDGICQMCDGVASMLRYSTSNDTGQVLLKEDAEHLEIYLYLIKQRLEERLEYSIDIDRQLLSLKIPKMIFQQIVENSVIHGYRNSEEIIRIEVKGFLDQDQWYMEFSDRGEGIPSDVLERLEWQIHQIGTEAEDSVLKQGLRLGGFGLISTYARLYLHYHGRVIWKIENREDGGVRITIGGPVDPPGTGGTG